MSNVLHFKNPNTGEVKVLKPGFNWLAFVSPLLLGIPLFIRRQWLFAVLALLVFPVTLIMGAAADLDFGPAFTIAMLCSAGVGTAFGFLAHENYIKSLVGRGFQKITQGEETSFEVQEPVDKPSFLKSKPVKIGSAATLVVLICIIAISQMGGSGSSSFKPDATTGLIEPTQKSMDGYYLPRCQREVANLMLNPETAKFYEAEYRYWDKAKRTSMRGGITLAAFENLPSDEQEERQQKELENNGLVFAQNLSNLPLVNVKVRVKGHNRYGQMVTSYGVCKFRERGQPTAEIEE